MGGRVGTWSARGVGTRGAKGVGTWSARGLGDSSRFGFIKMFNKASS